MRYQGPVRPEQGTCARHFCIPQQIGPDAGAPDAASETDMGISPDALPPAPSAGTAANGCTVGGTRPVFPWSLLLLLWPLRRRLRSSVD